MHALPNRSYPCLHCNSRSSCVTPVHDADDDDDIFGEDYCVDDDDDDAPAKQNALKHSAPSSPAKQAARKTQTTAAVVPSPTTSTHQASAKQALHFSMSARLCFLVSCSAAGRRRGRYACTTAALGYSQHLMCAYVACRDWKQSPLMWPLRRMTCQSQQVLLQHDDLHAASLNHHA